MIARPGWIVAPPSSIAKTHPPPIMHLDLSPPSRDDEAAGTVGDMRCSISDRTVSRREGAKGRSSCGRGALPFEDDVKCVDNTGDVTC